MSYFQSFGDSFMAFSLEGDFDYFDKIVINTFFLSAVLLDIIF